MKKILFWFVLLLPSFGFPAEYSLQLNSVRVLDLARIVYTDILRQNFSFDQTAIDSSDVVSVNWSKLSRGEVENMTSEIFQLRGFEVVKNSNSIIFRKREKQDEDLLIYSPRFRSAKYLADILAKVADVQQLGTRGMTPSPEMSAAISKQPEKPGQASMQFDRSANDQMAYSCMPKRCENLRRLLSDLDTPEAQIVIKAAHILESHLETLTPQERKLKRKALHDFVTSESGNRS